MLRREVVAGAPTVEPDGPHLRVSKRQQELGYQRRIGAWREVERREAATVPLGGALEVVQAGSVVAGCSRESGRARGHDERCRFAGMVRALGDRVGGGASAGSAAATRACSGRRPRGRRQLVVEGVAHERMREAKSQRRGPGRTEAARRFQLAQPRVEVGAVGLAADQEVTLGLDADAAAQRSASAAPAESRRSFGLRSARSRAVAALPTPSLRASLRAGRELRVSASSRRAAAGCRWSAARARESAQGPARRRAARARIRGSLRRTGRRAASVEHAQPQQPLQRARVPAAPALPRFAVRRHDCDGHRVERLSDELEQRE